MVSVKEIISVCAVAFFIGTAEAAGGNSTTDVSCEDQLYDSFCEYKQLVLTQEREKCLDARDILNEAVSNCVAEDPVKRMVQSVHYVRLFAPNCPNIELPSDGCGQLPTCLQMLFDRSGQRIRCCSKFKADRCFARAEKGCAYAAGVRDLFINQALPEVCKGERSVRYRETVIPSSCPASQY
ncbi:hypothetical protein EB796_006156 [Bugula neritina]|uniref:Uncharacterized protein n=1 Tax=Bugula neritina TaxID=10212 RepID=A0A7J7KD56_BUGNE|nr:hypothetical protein EB796_006156 [Bugula neritina]